MEKLPYYFLIDFFTLILEEDSEIQRDIKEWKSLLLSKPLDSSVTMIVKDILN